MISASGTHQGCESLANKNEESVRLLLLREKSPREGDGNHDRQDEMTKNARQERGGGGCIAVVVTVAVAWLLCCWTLECTTTTWVDTHDVHSSTEVTL